MPYYTSDEVERIAQEAQKQGMNDDQVSSYFQHLSDQGHIFEGVTDNTPSNPLEYTAGMASNIPGGFARLGQGLLGTFQNLPGTAKMLGRQAIGGIEKTTYDVLNNTVGRMVGKQVPYPPEDIPTVIQPFENVVQHAKGMLPEQLGPGGHLEQRMYNDPVGTLNDWSAALMGGGEMAKGLGQGNVVSNAMQQASTATNPVNLAMKGTSGLISKAQDAADFVSHKLAQSLIKPNKSEVQFGKDPVGEVIRQGIVGKNMQDLSQKVTDTTNRIGKAIEPKVQAEAKANPIIEDAKPLLKPLDDAMQAALGDETTPANPSLFQELKGIKNRLTKNYTLDGDGNPIAGSAKGLKLDQAGMLKLKRSVQGMVGFTGNSLRDDPVNGALWHVLENLKDNVNKNVPGVNDLNEQYSNLVGAKTALMRRAVAAQNSNILPAITSPIAAATEFLHGGGVSGAALAGLGTAALTKALGSAPGKMISAIGLNRLSRVPIPQGLDFLNLVGNEIPITPLATASRITR